MSKLVELDSAYWPREDYGYWCPACDEMHTIAITKTNHSGARWSFDNNLVAPTFAPSINMQINPRNHPHYQSDLPTTICHHFVQNGRIIYCGDCTHDKKGQTLDLPDFPPNRHITCRRLT